MNTTSLSSAVTLNSGSVEEVSDAAAAEISRLLALYHDKPILFLSSGGSSSKLLDLIQLEMIDEELTFGLLDDRFSADPQINNLLQVSRLDFYDRLMRRGVPILDTIPAENQSLDELAAEFDAGLKAWRTRYPQGKIIITQGVGPDGHTSGIMPYPEDSAKFDSLFLSSNWGIGYDAAGKNEYPQRISVTTTFLKDQVDHSVVYLVGQDKQSAFTKMLEKEGSLAEIPARIIWQMKEVKIFTDRS